MSRQVPKEDEIFVRKHFEAYLNGDGVSFHIDEEHTDCPDLVFESRGKRIGCEFATVTVEQLMAWAAHKQFGALRHRRKYVIVIPIEPHMWIQQLLAEKKPLVKKYIAHANLSECWLLLHCGSNSRKWFIPFDDGILEVFRAYAHQIASDFSKVLFLDQDKKIFELKSTERALSYDINSVTRRIQIGWPTQVLELVRLTLSGHETIDHEGLPVEEKVFIPYLEAGVMHGDPDARR